MPRKKNWRKAETKKTEWTDRSRTDCDGEPTDDIRKVPPTVGHRLNRQMNRQMNRQN